ncbi:hypothetical protein Nepgr_021086 [Nepenthes gracilis]|uniref:Uncharacterized protein n=1 Tax=Nepenthes gracilis TaxID=150966 RepID=A0AAD3XWW8_NEPGR|nr:hypothetical protein Nepgr_021086 [Nepenthes gracilis]
MPSADLFFLVSNLPSIPNPIEDDQTDPSQNPGYQIGTTGKSATPANHQIFRKPNRKINRPLQQSKPATIGQRVHVSQTHPAATKPTIFCKPDRAKAISNYSNQKRQQCFAEEIHQLSTPDHVVGLLDLKFNVLESPPNNPFSVLQDSEDSDEQEDLVDPVGRTVMNAQPSPHPSCSPHDPEIVGQQCCSMVEMS